MLSNLILISSIFLIISTARDAINLLKNKEYNISRIIAHFSFGLLILFIGLNYNFSSEKDFNLKVGEVKKFENFSIKFKDLNLKEFKNYKAVIGTFEIDDFKDNTKLFLSPQIRIYDNPSTLTYEASIRSGLLKDFYITMSNIDRSDYYNIKFQKNLLWFGYGFQLF